MLNRSDRDFHERLDQAAAQRAKEHNEQLARAAREHERVQEGAKLEIQRLILEQEQERIRREEAQRRELERLHQEKAQQEAEAQRRKFEAKQREEEAARKAAEQQRQLQEAEARIRAQKEQEETARKQKSEQEEAERKAKEAAAAAEKARAQQAVHIQQKSAPTSLSTVVTSTRAPQPPASEIEGLHAKYLELHKQMKEFRVTFAKRKVGDPLKEPIGDARRKLRMRMGQITNVRKDSVQAIGRMREEVFNFALNTPGPTIDIRPFIVNYKIPNSISEADAQYPAFLLYVFICFEKSLLKQFEKEAANNDGRIIQEIGLIAASLLADQKYMWNGIPMTDIVLAKLHHHCPILFGIRGDMSTREGQQRLGWLPIEGGAPEMNAYSERMKGLGCGFAALSLRQFSGKTPAIPMSEYWRAVVSICNTPPTQLYPGHFFVLRGLLQDYARKFMTFYGVQAKAVLRRATIDLPARSPQRAMDAAKLVRVLPDGWRNERISLD